jgi:RNA polymerase subunit RPABC4/transcription elongation factor Spt4
MAKKKGIVSLEGAVKTDEGLTYKGVVMEPIVEQCEGCERIVPFEDEKYCPTYAQPARKWAGGVCNFATHVRAEVDKAGKVKVNPLKASKRAARGR